MSADNSDSAAISAAEPWQDIATAPRDTLCLLFEPHDEGGFCFVGCTNMDGEWVNNLDFQAQRPTLWQPLIAPGTSPSPQPTASQERAQIVAWLRDEDYWLVRDCDHLTREDYADAIEAGEHLSTPAPEQPALEPMQRCPSCGTRFQKVNDVDAHLASLEQPDRVAKLEAEVAEMKRQIRFYAPALYILRETNALKDTSQQETK